MAAEILGGYGTRVQESVFECPLDDRRVAEVTRRVRRVLGNPPPGGLRIYRLCGGCLAASIEIGVGAGAISGGAYLVV